MSVEFAQHRPYTPGDDLRYLDWKVFGRTDKLYLKQYQKDRITSFLDPEIPSVASAPSG